MLILLFLLGQNTLANFPGNYIRPDHFSFVGRVLCRHVGLKTASNIEVMKERVRPAGKLWPLD